MQKNHFTRAGLCLGLLIALTACGSGGGGEKSNPQIINLITANDMNGTYSLAATSCELAESDSDVSSGFDFELNGDQVTQTLTGDCVFRINSRIVEADEDNIELKYSSSSASNCPEGVGINKSVAKEWGTGSYSYEYEDGVLLLTDLESDICFPYIKQ